MDLRGVGVGTTDAIARMYTDGQPFLFAQGGGGLALPHAPHARHLHWAFSGHSIRTQLFHRALIPTVE